MTTRIVLFCFIITLFSCKQEETSAIEIIKFDNRLIDTLTITSDTTYSTFIGRQDFYSADFYVTNKDSLITKILKDSLGNIVGVTKSKNGVTMFAAEYYPNGQLIGKTEYMPGAAGGAATYYYPDGRIKSTGQWQNHVQVGTWKNYEENGRLNEIVYYDSSGDVIKTDSLK